MNSTAMTDSRLADDSWGTGQAAKVFATVSASRESLDHRSVRNAAAAAGSPAPHSRKGLCAKCEVRVELKARLRTAGHGLSPATIAARAALTRSATASL